MRDLFGAILRVKCKKLAKDEKESFCAPRYDVKAVILLFCVESQDNGFGEGKGCNAPP
jgi:hypothetical protein